MIEILVVRDPDGGDAIRVWRYGIEVTADADIIIVDAGRGYNYADWIEAADYSARGLTPAAAEAVRIAYADPPGRKYIDGFPEED